MWTGTTSVACSTPQVAEAVRPRPRAVSVAAARDSPAIIIRDLLETEGWRRRNRTLPRWWTECRRYPTGGPSHLDTHTHTGNSSQNIVESQSLLFLFCLCLTQEYTYFHQHGSVYSSEVLGWRWSCICWSGLFLTGVVSPAHSLDERRGGIRLKLISQTTINTKHTRAPLNQHSLFTDAPFGLANVREKNEAKEIIGRWESKICSHWRKQDGICALAPWKAHF